MQSVRNHSKIGNDLRYLYYTSCIIESLELYTIDLHISDTGLMSYARLSISTEIESKYDEHEGIFIVGFVISIL